MNTEKYFEQILAGKELSPKQKIKFMKELVGTKIYTAIEENALIARMWWKPVSFKVTTRDPSCDDEAVKQVLSIIWGKDVHVSSKQFSSRDMGGDSENYITKNISFNF